MCVTLKFTQQILKIHAFNNFTFLYIIFFTCTSSTKLYESTKIVKNEYMQITVHRKIVANWITVILRKNWLTMNWTLKSSSLIPIVSYATKIKIELTNNSFIFFVVPFWCQTLFFIFTLRKHFTTNEICSLRGKI